MINLCSYWFSLSTPDDVIPAVWSFLSSYCTLPHHSNPGFTQTYSEISLRLQAVPLSFVEIDIVLDYLALT